MADDKPVAANVLGTAGTILWCVQLVPQIWHNWRNKKTDGLPPSMMLLWALCAPPFGVYMVLQQVNIPIQVQPQAFGALCLVSWAQILYYNHGYSALKATVVGVGVAAFLGGVEALLILTLRIPYRKGVTWPNLLMGVIATILLILGYIPAYKEIWKRRGRVVGFNWIFLGMDTSGSVLSLLALIAEHSYDPLGLVIYISVTVLEVGIYTSHIIWRLRHRTLVKETKAAGKSIDEMLQDREISTSASKDPNSSCVDDVEGAPAVALPDSHELHNLGEEKRTG